MNPCLAWLHFYLPLVHLFLSFLVHWLLSPKQEAIQLDGEIFFSLLRRTCPMAYRHLKKFKIDPILYMTEWFMCIFSRTLPWACVLRVWDMFFCEGTALVLTGFHEVARFGTGSSRLSCGSHRRGEDRFPRGSGAAETNARLCG